MQLKDSLEAKIPGKYTGPSIALSEINIETARKRLGTYRLEYVLIENLTRQLKTAQDEKKLEEELVDITTKHYLDQGYSLKKRDKRWGAILKRGKVEILVLASAFFKGQQARISVDIH